MDWLIVTFLAVSLLAALLVIGLGIRVRRIPGPDHESEAEALAARVRSQGATAADDPASGLRS